MLLQPIRGMKDLLPEEFAKHAHIINIASGLATSFCYKQMSVPIMEYTSVFSRTLGDTSDVVSKEMYSFEDRSGESITLRPEFTASIMRSFISHKLHQELPIKYFAHGPVFRYDRPQAGRQRQFHQLNYEFLGADGPYTDAEMICLAQKLLESLGVGDVIKLELNSLGCGESRARYVTALREYFLRYFNDLSEDSKLRLDKNPLRILDSKAEQDRILLNDAPFISTYYTKESLEYFESVQKYLTLFDVKYQISPRLVRGLDYYSHTAFEFTTDKLGAQSTVLAGGRYDSLSKIMGGPDIPAIGFAAGIERLAILLDHSNTALHPIYIIPVDEQNLDSAVVLFDSLRRKTSLPIAVAHKGKLTKKMQIANKNNASYVIFVGDSEVASGNYKIRNMNTGFEEFLNLNALYQKFSQNS